MISRHRAKSYALNVIRLCFMNTVEISYFSQKNRAITYYPSYSLNMSFTIPRLILRQSLVAPPDTPSAHSCQNRSSKIHYGRLRLIPPTPFVVIHLASTNLFFP